MMKMFLQKRAAGARRIGLSSKHLLRRLCRDTSAGTAMIFALSLVPLILAVGGAVDFSRYYDARESIQAALDSSVLAGAAKSSSTIAADTFNAWKVTVADTPITASSSNYTGCTSSDTTCTGTISTTIKTYFSALVGVRTLTLHVVSVAEKTGSSASAGNLCMLLVNTSASPGLNVNGNTISASTCEIDVYSKSTHAVTFDRTVTIGKICVAGTSSVNVTPSNYYQSCTVQSDPYAGSLPTISHSSYCPSATGSDDNSNDPPMNTTGTFSNIHCNRINLNGGTHTLYPGVYGGGINFNNSPTVTFKPGLYIIKNVNWNLDGGTYTGSGVTFYYPTSGVFMQYNNSAMVTLSAPTSDTYKGILMYEPSGLSTSAWTMNVNATFTGLMDLPSRAMTFNSGGPVTTAGLLVFDTLITSTTFTMSPETTSVGASGSVVRLKK